MKIKFVTNNDAIVCWRIHKIEVTFR